MTGALPWAGEPAGLPAGWSATIPDVEDLPDLHALAQAHADAVTGSSVREQAVTTEAVGPGSWTRRQRLFRDADGQARAWARVHDRAAGRTDVEVTLHPLLQDVPGLAAQVAASAYTWVEEVGGRIARGRGLGGTLLDASRDERDRAAYDPLVAAGFERTRTWLQMRRPVTAQEVDLDERTARAGVRARRVAQRADGSPVAADIQTVHRMLEESFADHFNSYRESFPEFLHRLREDPGHRWDHWWIAEIEVDGAWVPGGALVGTVSPTVDGGSEGSYVEYIGVHRIARGRGVAKALLHAVIADAARRGRDRVGLEVDADSPTGADGLYVSMGWESTHRTESWHRAITVPGDAPILTAKGE